HILPDIEHDAQADAGGMPAQREPLLHGEQNLADAEQADNGDQKIDAAQKLGRAKGHAQLAGHGVEADAGEQEAYRHRDDGLVLFLAPQAYERAEGEQIDGEEFRWSELEREGRNARREKCDKQYG